jgi:hypothetical protein
VFDRIRARSFPALLVAVVFGLCLGLATDPVCAQGKKKGGGGHSSPGSAKPKTSGKSAGPPAAASGHGGGAIRPGAAKPRGAAPKAKGEAKPKAPVGPMVYPNPDELPPGYVPPPAVPDQLKLDKPLKANWSEAEWKKNATRYGTLIRNGAVKTDEERKLIHDAVQYQLYQMTVRRELKGKGKDDDKVKKEEHHPAYKFRADLMRDLKSASSVRGAPMTARDEFLKSLTQEIGNLLDNHFVVRLNVAIMLADINQREADEKANPPLKEQPCPGAAVPALKILADKNQLDAVKIWGLKAVTKIAPDNSGIVSTDLKQKIVEAVINELRDSREKNKHEWYQLRLVESLGTLGAVDPTRATVIATLMDVMRDQGKDAKEPAKDQANPKPKGKDQKDDERWRIRSAAARALARVPLDKSINVPLITWATMQLGGEMTDAYIKDPKKSYWTESFFNLYLAFHPLNAEETAKKQGLLRIADQRPQDKKMVEEAYQQLLPMVRLAISTAGGTKAPDSSIKPVDEQAKLKEWVQNNRPTNLSLGPNMPKLEFPLASDGSSKPPTGG